MLCKARSLPSRILQKTCRDRSHRYQKIIHNTGWHRLEKTVLKRWEKSLELQWGKSLWKQWTRP